MNDLLGPTDPEFEARPPEAVERASVPGKPWGPWSSLAWTILVFLGYSVVQGIFALAFSSPAGSLVPGVRLDGRGVAIGMILAFPIGVAAVVMVVRIRGLSVRDYLAFRWPAWGVALAWLGLSVALMAASDGLSYALGKPIIPDVQVQMYRSAGSILLLAVALSIGAPFIEEVLFRGLLYRGLAESRLGRPGAIALTAVLFGVLHVQYDLYGIGLALVQGLFLGLARDRTRSTPLAILLHGLHNGLSLVETGFIAGMTREAYRL
jgi:membrane protease YdiL (CAAX protease family)